MRDQRSGDVLDATEAGSRDRPARGGGVHDVRAYGATGDDGTLDTPAINAAIAAAHAAGGGTVYFPAGTYTCYSIRLKSNVALYIDQGATILAADNPLEPGAPGYDPPEPNQWDPYEDFGHSHWHNSLIWGENLENVSILGPGMIDGKGLTTGGNRAAGRDAAGRVRGAAGDDRPARRSPARPARHHPVRLPRRRLAPARHRQQGHRAEALPQRHPQGLHDLPRRPLRDPRDRRRQLHPP